MATDEDQKDQESQEETSEDTSSEEPFIEPTQSDDSIPEDKVNELKSSITKDLTGKISQEVSESVTQKIGKALGLTKEEEEALPKDPKELQKLIDEKVDAKVTQIKEQEQEQQQAQVQEREEKIKGIVDGWNQQYSVLAQSGKLPSIKNPADENDPGVKARRKIILHIGKMIDNLKQQGSNYVPSISDALVENPNLLKDELPGADLPISGNTAVRQDSDSFSYEEIAGKTFEQIAQES